MKIVPVAGWYYEPTIVDTELFGPMLSVLRFRIAEHVESVHQSGATVSPV